MDQKCYALIRCHKLLNEIGYIEPSFPKPKPASFIILKQGIMIAKREVEQATQFPDEREKHLERARDILALMNLRLPLPEDRPREKLQAAAAMINMCMDLERWSVLGKPDASSVHLLEAIKGIGPIFARELEMGGIKTLHQLAKSDPAKVREILFLESWQAAWKQVPAWISQARELTGTKLVRKHPVTPSKLISPAIQPEVIQS